MSCSASRHILAFATPVGGAITFHLFPQLKLTVSCWQGRIDGEGMVAAYRSLFGNGQWQPTYDELADLRQAETSGITTDSLRQLAALEGQSTDQTRSAVLTNGGLSFGLARMYGALAEAGARLEVFTDAEEALAWLEAPTDLLRELPDSDGKSQITA